MIIEHWEPSLLFQRLNKMPKTFLVIISNFPISIIIIGFVFYDAYSKKRYNLKASVLWALFAGFLPLLLGIPLYLLFRPRRNTNLAPSKIKLGAEETKCIKHSEVKADRLCSGCRYAYCEDCLTKVKNKSYCQSCLDFLDKKYKSLNKLLMIFSLIFLALITFMLGFIVPKFAGIFETLGGDLPILTLVMIKISSFAWILGLLLATLIIFLFRNVKSMDLLKRLAPQSYAILLIFIWALPGLLIALIVFSMFSPIHKITELIS
jgi:hypothetical protein